MEASKIAVLDHGHVEYVDHMGSDLTVVNSARVSFSKHVEEFSDKDEKLINYLAKHKHWTPFGHPQITFRIKAPIFVRTQLFKHKVGFTENEVSRRYVDEPPQFYVPQHFRTRPDNMKQGSSDDVCAMGNAKADVIYRTAMAVALDTYNQMLEGGVAPEIARGILPQSTYTEWYWTGSLAAFARVHQQRNHPTAQKETKLFAQAMGALIWPLFPYSWQALCGHYGV